MENIYRKIRDLTGERKTKSKEKLKMWQDYISELFSDARPDQPQYSTNLSGPCITIDKVCITINQLKNGKVTGPDEFHGEFLKLLDEDEIKWLTVIYNKIYELGRIPESWLKSEFVTMQELKNAEYRTLSLMSHLLKTFLKIIHRRLYMGSREALFSMQVLVQPCRDVNCDVYLCLIDFQKAFDRVKYHKMVEILKDLGLDGKDLGIIGNFYWNQMAFNKA